MEAIAEIIDCENFHRFYRLQYGDIDARQQYNILCLYIAKIYNSEKNYKKVYEWSSHLAYIPHYNIEDWSKLLTKSDFDGLVKLISNRDDSIDVLREVYELENSKLVI